jgi:hypothetical protein
MNISKLVNEILALLPICHDPEKSAADILMVADRLEEIAEELKGFA